MFRQFSSRGHAPSLAYGAVNTLIWVSYAALVLLVIQMLHFHSPVAVAAATLAAAVVLNPLRRRAARAAGQRFGHR
ncbi:MAG TPA: hypothetical protein VEF71_03225 [Streptosporangiaceae bacterium]|nr:hypothetical protein [Streptosporangiaceae bacterium]